MQQPSPRLRLAPISLAEANEYVRAMHRHHGPTRGHKFSIAAKRGADLVGVVIVGRHADNGETAEVLRLCADGTQNACSLLYGAAARAAAAMGYTKIITYTLASEPGGSLKAAGWGEAARVRGRSWSCPSRPCQDQHPLEDKIRWERVFDRSA